MVRAKTVFVALGLVALVLARHAAAIDEFQWNSGLTGSQAWDVNGNWSMADYPNAGDDMATIAVASDLTLNLGANDITVAALLLNGTASGTDISITSGGSRLILQNDDNNLFTDQVESDTEDTMFYEGANLGRVFITSNGAAGSTNTISAPVRLRNNGFHEGVDVYGSRSLTFSGPIDIDGSDATLPGLTPSPVLRSYLPTTEKVLITGNINLTDIDGLNGRLLRLNDYFTSNTLSQDSVPPRGVIEITGVVSGTGSLWANWSWDVDGADDNTKDFRLNPAPVPIASKSTMPTVILRGNNTFSGDMLIGRGNLVVGHNNALGTDTVTQRGPAGNSKEVGYNIISTADDRVIPNTIAMSEWTTVRGASDIAGLEYIGDHSITFSGEVIQSNTRGWVNLLPYDFAADEGKTLTFTGPLYPKVETEYFDDNESSNPVERFFTFDGTGKTVVNGGLFRVYNNEFRSGITPHPYEGNLRIRGTGAVYIDWVDQGMIPNPQYDADTNPGVPQMIPDRPTEYVGYTRVEGGNLHFAENEDLPGRLASEPLGEMAPLREILSSGGAVGVDAGVVGNAHFLKMLNNSAKPNASGSVLGTIFLTYGTTLNPEVLWTTYDYGGLMLGTNEYDQNLDFSVAHSSDGNLARAANMSLAAHEGGSVYTGTITPAGTYNGFNVFGDPNANPSATGIPVNPNTYQLGGGSGTLQLPNQNQLTGARNLLVKNGGEVWLSNTNNYTGTTRVIGHYATSLQENAEVNTSDSDADFKYGEEVTRIYVESKLTVSHLGNGGSPSSIGSSSSAAENLVIQGSTLRYVGAGQTTDRLFTIGTRGATLDASSASGALVFNNTGALGVDYAETRAGLLKPDIPGDDNMEIVGMPILSNATKGQHLFSTEDLLPGMRVIDQLEGTQQYLVDDDSPIVITGISSPHVVQIGETDTTADLENDMNDTAAPFVWSGFDSDIGIRSRFFQFGPSPARMLTLTGSNSMNNTLAPLVGNEPTAGAPGGAALAATAEEIAAGYGTVGVRKTGSGKWILTGNNTYSGPTNVEEGTLLINGDQSAATGLTTVASGAKLGGTGTIGGDVVMQEGSIFTASFSGGTIDPLAILGDLDLSALNNILEVTGSGTGSSWVLATYSGTLLGEFESTPGFTVDYGTGSNSQITLMAAAGIPGDYNGDGRVDGGDYVRWRNNLGDPTEADINNNGDGGGVGISDYAFWKARYGNPGSGGGGLAGAVPEPASAWLVGMALASIGLIRSRRATLAGSRA